MKEKEKTNFQPEGIKKENDQNTKERRKKKGKARKLEENWNLLRECIQYIEENEPLLIASRMERSYDQEKRLTMWERETSKPKTLTKPKLKEERDKENFWNT